MFVVNLLVLIGVSLGVVFIVALACLACGSFDCLVS